MKNTNPNGDKTIRPFPGDTHGETCISGEGSMAPDSPVEDPDVGAADSSGSPKWADRLKRRWNSMLEWLAQGAEHSCPT